MDNGGKEKGRVVLVVGDGGLEKLGCTMVGAGIGLAVVVL